MLLFTRV